MSNWKKNLKVGDQVIVSSSEGDKVDIVKRVTVSQIFLEKTKTRYRIDSGGPVPGSLCPSKLKKPTKERLIEATDDKQSEY